MPHSQNTLLAHCHVRLVTEIDDAFVLESAGYPASEGATHHALTYRQTHAPHLFLGLYVSLNDHAAIDFSTLTPHVGSSGLIGFVSATAYDSPHLLPETMSTHQAQATNVFIHSVCVHPQLRRQGLALALLCQFMNHLARINQAIKGQKVHADWLEYTTEEAIVQRSPVWNHPQSPTLVVAPESMPHDPYQTVLLISHEYLFDLYKKAGFQLNGRSSVIHGKVVSNVCKNL
ncbi:hypothetical protein H4R34_004073 [Dimargaris verticillata]|uniref:N-acetyltransferase domain-containing protein n=1 Tax=Dimargaris verticillata TaxID=2761393 RepID=A0A9W8E7L3_9FUNG|nr:hypothetical protein H4R34_004073 [Dimargaris verticillata]